MKCVYRFLKSAAILTVVVGGVAAASTIILGKENVSDIADTMRQMARDGAAELVDERAALERRVKKLKEDYPKRIAELRSMIKETESQLAVVENDKAMCEDVLALCQEDIATLKSSQIAGDENQAVKFRGRVYSQREADAMVSQAVDTAERYRERFNALVTEEELISSELANLQSELHQVRKEQQEFETELNAVQREINRIEHNERLIEFAQKRQSLSDRRSSEVEVNSMRQLREQLDRVRIEQEETLRALRVEPKHLDYEARVKLRRAGDKQNEDVLEAR